MRHRRPFRALRIPGAGPTRVAARLTALLRRWPTSHRLLGPACGSAYSVPRSPFVVGSIGSPTLGYSRRRGAHARMHMGTPVARLTRPWSVWLRDSLPPPAQTGNGNYSPGVFSPSARSSTKDPVPPGGSTHRHLPPSGFDYPLDGLLSFVPGDDPSAIAAPMGFLLQGLAPTDRRYPSRGLASHVVPTSSFRRSHATPEDSSGRGGARRAPARTRRPPNLALLDVRPSKAFPCSALHRLPGTSPSFPSSGGALYRSTSGRGFKGCSCVAIGLSLSRLPAFLGFCTFPKHSDS
jgi:hypothetical protein